MQIASVVLFLGYYVALLALVWNYGSKLLIWVRAEHVNEADFRRPSMTALARSVCDLLSFRRLLIANDLVWAGEFAFHVSFVLVMLRHLRYFLDPVPKLVEGLQTAGVIAGYILPVSLVYILTVKVIAAKKKYVSSYNFSMLALILALSVTGLLMNVIFHPDVVSVKTFAVGLATFTFTTVPASGLFIFHFIAFLVLIFKLPTHIFAAPLTLISAREREENVHRIIHEKER